MNSLRLRTGHGEKLFGLLNVANRLTSINTHYLHIKYIIARMVGILVTNESRDLWNNLTFGGKVTMVAIKKLSYNNGYGIPYSQLTPLIVDLINCKATSISGFVRGLNNTIPSLTKSDDQYLGSVQERSLWVTEYGQRFIFQNQDFIDAWAIANKVKL